MINEKGWFTWTAIKSTTVLQANPTHLCEPRTALPQPAVRLPSHTLSEPHRGRAEQWLLLTSLLGKGTEVNSDVVLLTAQSAGSTFQVISVAGVLSDPLNLVAATGLGSEFGNSALSGIT